jgi:excisionase family DNA binding protein
MNATLLTTKKVAEMFAVTPSTVVKWADAGRLPFFRTPGGHRRYPRAEVEALRDSTKSAA